MTNARDDVPKAARPRAPVGIALAALAPALLVATLLAIPRIPLPRYQSRLPWSGGAAPWPMAPGPGERVSFDEPGVLLVQAPTRTRVRTLAARWAEARRRADEPLARGLAALRRAWREEMPLEPVPDLAPAAECAAWLRARAMVAQGLLAAGSEGGESPAGTPGPSPLTLLPPDHEAAWVAAARIGDPAALRAALVADMKDEAAWLADAERRGDPADVTSAWRDAWSRRAVALAAEAQALEQHLTPFQQELVRAVLPGRAWQIASEAPIPLTLPAPIVPAPERIPAVWLGALAIALAGVAGAIASLAVGRRTGRTAPPPSPLSAPAEMGVEVETHEAPVAVSETAGEAWVAPETREAWLHVVSGPNVGALARGALEVAAHFLARDQRVVLVDAGRRLGMHRFLRREHRWGLAECLTGEAPALGVVQDAGLRGFYLLSQGAGGRRPDWTQLGQLLSDLRPHFGRVLLTAEPARLREQAAVLSTAAPALWWAGADTRDRRLAVVARRLGSTFLPLRLDDLPRASVEDLTMRVATYTPVVSPAVVESAPVEPEVASVSLEDGLVLDCDLRVRERLRFLIWTRRVRSENRASTADPVAPAGAHLDFELAPRTTSEPGPDTQLS